MLGGQAGARQVSGPSGSCRVVEDFGLDPKGKSTSLKGLAVWVHLCGQHCHDLGGVYF